MHKAVADEASMARTFKDSVYGAENPRMGWSHEEDERHNKERRVQVLAAVKLGKRFALVVPALSHHFFVDTIPFAHPLCVVGGKSTLVGQPDAAIQGNPVHDFRVDKMFLAIAHLPNTGIWKLPVLTYPLKTLTDLYPNVVRSGADILVR